MLKRSDGWQLTSVVAGMVMSFWIVGEMASKGRAHRLSRTREI
jgi:hypothetical protein